MVSHHPASSYCLCVVILLCNIKTSVAAGEVDLQLTGVDYDTDSISPSEARAAVDGNVGTAWSLTNEQTTASFEAEFDRPYTVS